MPKMMSIKDAAAETGLPYKFIWELCVKKKIVFIKLGRKYFVNMDKFAEFLNAGGEVE